MDAMAKSDYKENDMMKAHRVKTAKLNTAYDDATKSNTVANPANPGDRSWGGPTTPPLTDNHSTKKVGKGKVGPKGTGDQS